MKYADLAQLLIAVHKLPAFDFLDKCEVNSKGDFGDTPLHVAAVWGDVDAINLLIRNGAMINAIGENGYTPLHEAIGSDNTDAAKELIASGADPFIKNTDGNDCFKLSEAVGNQEILAFLKSRYPS